MIYLGEKVRNNKAFTFYYDEAYHDLAITQKNGIQNINKSDASEYFVVSLVGIRKENINVILEKFSEIEKKYKKKIGIKEMDEFKGTTIKIKNYKYGFSTMKKEFLNFYTELFEMLNDCSAILQISTICKFEYVLHEIFNESYNMIIPKEFRPLIYSVVKFINQHKTEQLISLIHSDTDKTDEIITEIRTIISDIRKTRLGYKLKEHEVKIASDLDSFLSNISCDLNIKPAYEWNYKWSLHGLMNLMVELGINDSEMHLDIDGKGCRTNKIYQAAKELFPNADIDRCESKDNIGIRISDFISNLIGRLIKVVDRACNSKKDEIERTKKFDEMILLDNKWFDLSEDAFNCYKTIGEFFDRRTNIFWTTQVGVYTDIPIVIYSLFQYFSEQKSYEEFKKIDSSKHSMELNDRVVYKLKNIYEV